MCYLNLQIMPLFVFLFVCAAGDFASRAGGARCALVHVDNEEPPALVPARDRLECAVGQRVVHCREGARPELRRRQCASADALLCTQCGAGRWRWRRHWSVEEVETRGRGGRARGYGRCGGRLEPGRRG